MSVEELRHTVAEVNAMAVGGVVVKVRRPLPDHLALTVRHRGRNFDLVAGVAPGLARFHPARDLPPTPPGPGPFTLRARALMRPARLVSVTLQEDAPVVEVTVSRHGEGEREWRTTLAVECLPRGRMVLLDEARRVLMWHGPGGARGLETGQPYIPPEGIGRPPETGAAPVSSAELEARYARWLAARAGGAAHRESARALKTAHARAARKLAHMERDLERLSGWEAAAREGELLSGHRHLLKRGMTEVTVTDWFAEGCPQRMIPLDAQKTPEEQIAARFNRAKRAKRGIPQLAARIEAARVEAERLEAARAELDAGGDAAAILQRAGVTLPGARTAGKKASAPGVRAFEASDGRTIWVGRSGESNDRLTFRMANGNDLWLHARGVPGAHVVLHGRGEDSGVSVMEAAQLAAHFSQLKREGGGEVICTPRKYVRRPKGGKPGQALVTGEKVLQVRLDPERVARLLKRRA